MSPELDVNTNTCQLHDQWKQYVESHITRDAEEIKTLRDRSHKTANEITSVAGEVDKLGTELTHLVDRIPMDIGLRLVRFEMKIDEISKQLAADFVKRTEFEVMKVEHEQMKKIIYGFVTIVLLAVVGAIVALVVKQ